MKYLTVIYNYDEFLNKWYDALDNIVKDIENENGEVISYSNKNLLYGYIDDVPFIVEKI